MRECAPCKNEGNTLSDKYQKCSQLRSVALAANLTGLNRTVTKTLSELVSSCMLFSAPPLDLAVVRLPEPPLQALSNPGLGMPLSAAGRVPLLREPKLGLGMRLSPGLDGILLVDTVRSSGDFMRI
jgi:hypothetical protein